jgi:hypothetical protein
VQRRGGHPVTAETLIRESPVSPNTTPTSASSASNASPPASRAPYVPPTLESLGSWSTLTMVLTGGGGFVDLSKVKQIGEDQIR